MYMTVRHEKGGPCRGCGDHTKYRKHQKGGDAESWLTIPVATTSTQEEGKALEAKLIKVWKPEINYSTPRYDLLKQTYARDIKARPRPTATRKPAPWKDKEDQPETTGKMMTQYDVQGQSAYDLDSILRAAEGTSVTITAVMGHHDMTDWRQLRARWGKLPITVTKNGQTTQATLNTWRPREEGFNDNLMTMYTYDHAGA